MRKLFFILAILASVAGVSRAQVPFYSAPVPSTTTITLGTDSAPWDSVYAKYAIFGNNVVVSGTLTSGAINGNTSLAPSTAPSFAGMTLTGALDAGSNTITSGLINGQEIDATAHFTGSVSTPHNTLDDGSGNATLSGNLAVNGTGTSTFAGTVFINGATKASLRMANGQNNWWIQNENLGSYPANSTLTFGIGGTPSTRLSINGAGDATLSGNLSVNGTGTSYIMGSLGVGTSSVPSGSIAYFANSSSDGVSDVAIENTATATNSLSRLSLRTSATSGAIGQILFEGHGASPQYADIGAYIAGTNGAYFTIETKADGGSLIERMRITDGGHVLIGTTTDNGRDILQTNGSNYLGGNINQPVNAQYYSTGYLSGWGNTGFDLSTDASGVSNLVVDNLTVRRTMSVYELLLRQIRATNGNLFVTASAQVDSVSVTGDTLWFNDETQHNMTPFAVNDIILAQRWNPQGDTILSYHIGTITSLSGLMAVVSYDASSVGTFEAGETAVRIGNTTDATRQGSIYLAADDDNEPFIDVRNGVNSVSAWGTSATKVRLGNLSGITDSHFGALSGYGLYGQNVYLTGSFWLSSSSNISSVPAFQSEVSARIADSSATADSVSSLRSGITQNVSGISLEVSNRTTAVSNLNTTLLDSAAAIRTTTSSNSSAINVNSSGISLEVTNRETAVSNLNSTLLDSASAIRTTTSSNTSAINANASSISLEVSNRTTAVSNVNNALLDSASAIRTVTSANSSSIDVNANSISSEVTTRQDDVTTLQNSITVNAEGTTIISTINGTSSSTNINGDKIRSGALISTNWSGTAGTDINLDAGTILVGGSTAPALSWNGSTLSINGSGTFTGNVTASTLTATSSGTIANWTINSSYLNQGDIYIGNDLGVLTNSNGQMLFGYNGSGSAPILEMLGNNTGSGYPEALMEVDGSGRPAIGVSNGSIWNVQLGRLDVFGGSAVTGIKILNSAGTTVFDVDDGGTANIASWNFDHGHLWSDAYGNYAGLMHYSGSGSGVAFYAGASDNTGTGATFRVSQNGALYATSATITGAISSGSTITGTTITGGSISNTDGSTNINVSLANGELGFNEGSPATASGAIYALPGVNDLTILSYGNIVLRASSAIVAEPVGQSTEYNIPKYFPSLPGSSTYVRDGDIAANGTSVYIRIAGSWVQIH